MIVAMDFDDTYTLDPAAWDVVIRDLENAGHEVICVTCRRDTDENREKVQCGQLTVYFTGLRPKREFMLRRGVKVDVWIDDDPNCVENGK